VLGANRWRAAILSRLSDGSASARHNSPADAAGVVTPRDPALIPMFHLSAWVTSVVTITAVTSAR
jgi:hypothetical protein